MADAIENRFARHTLIPGWDQARLRQSSLILIGMGAVGNEVARLLVLSGIGHLTLCDPDRIETSNLSRCALFCERDVGRLKAEVAAESLVELDPNISVEFRPQPLVNGIGLAELRDADLVLSCLDTRSARLELAGRCGLVRAPWIDGGTHPWGGEVRPFLDPDGPCYGCGLTVQQRSESDVPISCLQELENTSLGATALASVLVGAWMANLAVRFLLHLPVPTALLKIDAVRATMSHLSPRRDLDCPLHEPIGTVTRLPLGNGSSLQSICSLLPTNAVPLTWDPIQSRLQCLTCGHERVRWGHPERTECPHCHAILQPWTTLELSEAPGMLTLAQLGVAPREIFAVRTGACIEWFELAAGVSEGL